MLVIIVPRYQLPQEISSLAPGMIRQGIQGVGVERNSTRTERCTVGYAKAYLSFGGVTCRAAGVYEYLLLRRVPSTVRETLRCPRNDFWG